MSAGHTNKATDVANADATSHLDADQSKRLATAAALPDDEINLSDPDAPEVTDWSGAVRGKFYRPIKTLKSLRLDADVLAWFQAQGPGYQTRINTVLRQAMLRELRRLPPTSGQGSRGSGGRATPVAPSRKV